MNHTLCITKALNHAVTVYKNHWKACVAAGAILAGFWMVERQLSSHIANTDTFFKHEIFQAPNSTAVFNKIVSLAQNELYFSRSNSEYITIGLLLLVLLYIHLVVAQMLLLLYRNQPISIRALLIPFGLYVRTIAVYLFVALFIVAASIGGALILKMCSWFLLSREHAILVIFIYTLLMCFTVLVSFNLIPWCVVDGSTSVSQAIDRCLYITRDNKLKIIIINLLTHLIAYAGSFLLLRIPYNLLISLNAVHIGLFFAHAIILPFSWAVWTSVYLQLKK